MKRIIRRALPLLLAIVMAMGAMGIEAWAMTSADTDWNTY